MGVYKRKSIWYIAYHDGTQRVRKRAGKSKTMALAVLKRKEAEATLRAFNLPLRSEITFKKLTGRYLTWAKDHKRSWELEQQMINLMADRFGALKLDRITPWHIEQMKTDLRKQGLSGPRVNRYLASLSKMFNLGIRWGLTDRNPVKGVEKYRENPGRLRYLSQEEIARLLLACRPDLRNAVTVAVSTGLRKSEQFNLTWADLDLEHRLIFIRDSKSGKARQVPMSDRVLEVFKRMRESRTGEVVFPSAQSMMRTAWEKTRKRAGLTGPAHVRWHDLRHYAERRVMPSRLRLGLIPLGVPRHAA